MIFDSFIGPSYVSASQIADGEELINWYRERMESQGAPVRWALYPTPGVESIVEATVAPGRGHIFAAGREFAVIGTTLYEVSEAGALTSRGTVALDANPATLAYNGDGGNQLAITSGANYYNYDMLTNTLSQIAALNGKATQCDHVDGYFLVIDANTGTVYYSALLDGTSWTTGTDFFQRSAKPDPWVAIKVMPSRNILIMGTETSEVWYDAGNSSTPFTLHPSGVIPYGVVSPFSAAIAGRDVLWLGTTTQGSVQVLRMAGFQPAVVSTYPFQTEVEAYDDNTDAVGDAYSERGHTFYLLSFPTDNVTWCWDAETSEWHKRGTWMADDNEYTVLRQRYHVSAFGEHRMLDAASGAIYRMSSTIHYDIDGVSGVRRLRRAPGLISENNRVYYAELELIADVGIGLTSGQGSDPQIMMRASDDGGKTYGSERWTSLGKIGAYDTRIVWNRLGSALKRVFEVVTTDPVPVRIVQAYLRLGEGTSVNEATVKGGASAG